MKVGDMVSILDVKNQSEHKWVTLSPLTLDENGFVNGGRVAMVSDLSSAATDVAIEARENGDRSLVLAGLPDTEIIITGLVVDNGHFEYGCEPLLVA
ncbi:MAG: hypothetical protein LBE35_10135 [Clostridiales bacterium]|nr:hypothetical protein [Clostridiales bacterium]